MCISCFTRSNDLTGFTEVSIWVHSIACCICIKYLISCWISFLCTILALSVNFDNPCTVFNHSFLERYARHIWELPVLCYHEIMVMYPYPFLVLSTQLFSCIIFINDYINILTVSPGSYLFMIVYVIQKIRGNENSPDSLTIMVNYHYHDKNRVITK